MNAIQKNQKLLFFVSTQTFLISANGTINNSIAIAKDKPFVVTKLSQFSTIAGAGQTASNRVLPLVNILITDTSENWPLFDNPTPIPNIFGDGSIPFILPTPYMFPYNGSVLFTLSSFDAVNAYSVNLSLIGYKVLG